MSDGYKFSTRSLHNLRGCHPDLIALCKEAIDLVNFTVMDGHRTKEEQNRLYDAGKSQLKWPESKHNRQPSMAVDIVPYPIDWKDHERMVFLSGIMKGLAHRMQIDIRLGIDWDGDGVLVPNDEDESFADYPHIELV